MAAFEKNNRQHERSDSNTAASHRQPHLHQQVPVCDGFPRVRQHFTPVFSTQTLGLCADTADADHFVVSDPEGQRRRKEEFGFLVLVFNKNIKNKDS